MSFSEKIKNFYYLFEDKWYSLLDKIDPKTHVYKIIDPIDKVIPSFVLFLLIVLFIFGFSLYLVKFTSPYNITFSVYDSQTKNSLGGVMLAGTINNEIFSERTSADGKAFVTTNSIKQNFFELAGSIFFGNPPIFFGVISASKDGYKRIKDEIIELSDKENSILLERASEEEIFPSTYTVGLISSETMNTIVDSYGMSYIKFKCANKDIPGQVKRVTDLDDASNDGLFVLNENNCAFIVTEAYAPGYEALGTAVTLPTNKDRFDITLQKISDPNTGTAKVGVYSSGTNGNTMLSKIRVSFHKGPINDYAITDNGGWAEKIFEEGSYAITISDENYYPISADSNIFINIKKGQTTTLMIKLTEIRPEDKRMVFFKVVDEDGNALSNVNVEMFDAIPDSNGVYFGTTPDNTSYYYTGAPNVTDKNGLYKRTGLSIMSTHAFATLEKEGYLYNPFKPALLKLTDSYETIVLKKANSSNSGMATITVKSSNGKLLQRANAFLYLNIIIDGIQIKNWKLKKDGILTNSTGVANYPQIPMGTYAASAYFDGAFSEITHTKDIDVNQTVNFDVNINIDVAYLKIELVDAQTLAGITNADVNVFFIEENNLVFSEKLSQSSGFFTSKGYEKNSQLAVTGKAVNYVPNTIYLNGLAFGENSLLIKLYTQGICRADGYCNDLCDVDPDCGPCVSNDQICPEQCDSTNDNDCESCVADGQCTISCGARDPDCDCGSNNICNEAQCGDSDPDCRENDSNVSVYFDDVYSKNESYYTPQSSVIALDINGEYNLKFDIITRAPISYNTLLGMVRANGPVEFTNSVPNDPDPYRKEQNLFKCNNSTNDSISGIHDDNYYFPTSCNNINYFGQAGYIWGNENVPVGTYSFVASIKVSPNAENNDSLLFQYRAKEKNSSNSVGASETPLQDEEFFVGQPIHSGMFFSLKLGNRLFNIKSNNINNIEKVTIYPQQENDLSIQLRNNTKTSLTNGSLKIYSYSGQPSLTANYSASKGNIFFDGGKTTTEKILSSSLVNISPRGVSTTFDTGVYADKFNSTNWLVIVAHFDQNTFVGFVDAKSIGKTLFLSAEFLAGFPDQLFDGEVTDRFGSGNPIISDVSIEVDRNCRSTQQVKVGEYSLSAPSENIDENYFVQQIDGVYEYMQDCVYVSVNANNEENEYAPINRQKIYAGSGNANDPSLACIDISSDGSTQNSYFEEEINLYWGNQKDFTIKNHCSRPVTISIDVGLLCNTSEGDSCKIEKTINANAQRKYTITGKNITFDSTKGAPNFTDILGYYPLIVKAKFADKTRNKFAIAARAHVHLSNPNQCFAISKDYFDFTISNTSEMDLVFTNHCQYIAIGDYLIPSVNINAFGYELNTNKPNYTTVVFTPKATVTGSGFVTTYVDVIVQTWGSTVNQEINIENSAYLVDGNYVNFVDMNWDNNYDFGNNPVKYYGLSFNLENEVGKIDTLQFRFIDINNDYFGDTGPYGAAIDGNIIINYKDGNVVHKKTSWNFEFDPLGKPICVQDESALALDSCEITSAQTAFIQGKINISISPAKEISRVDLNILGNQDSELLETSITPHTSFIQSQPETHLNNSVETVSYDLTSVPVSIPAKQGIIYSIKRLVDLNYLSQTVYTAINNPKIIIGTDNPNVLAWIDGDSLKATFVGEDYVPFNSTQIESSLVKTFGQSITYGTVDITDFVSMETAGSRKISGVQ